MTDTEQTRRQKERQRLFDLGAKRPTDDKGFPYSGVLLSDAIEFCVDRFDLIRPFHESLLKPANYKLTIGDQVAIGGNIRSLYNEEGKNEIRIEPFQVAVIKTRETLNMPNFLIARWNIRVELAYKGLLWVGGPQVDAGYVGHLFCPIYNLSDKSVVLRFEEPIAVIDFVRTSDFKPKLSKEYPQLPPERILIEDYTTNLKSALYGLVESLERFGKRVDSVDSTVVERIDGIQGRVDNFISITFAVVGLLFAAVTLFFGRPNEPNWWDPSVFWISALAIIISMFAWVNSKGSILSFRRPWQRILFEFFLVTLVVMSMWHFSSRSENVSRLKRQVSTLEEQVESLKNQVNALASKEASDLPSKAPPTWAEDSKPLTQKPKR